MADEDDTFRRLKRKSIKEVHSEYREEMRGTSLNYVYDHNIEYRVVIASGWTWDEYCNALYDALYA